MPFVDEARIFVKAGDGGKGCESFYRDKYMRYPKPDGGDGGKGGDIVFRAKPGIRTLLDYRYKQHYRAARGGHGGSKGKRGRNAPALILDVPLGTIVRDQTEGLLIRDLASAQATVVVAKGGSGGGGNKNKRASTPPGLGEERTVHLELKLMADIGLVGFPNAGKSTLICAVSKVRSRIGSYPFTTRQPVLGVIDLKGCSYIMADLPGLIEGAHKGRGLGDRFLRHAERTRVIAHVIDMAGSEGRDPLDDFAVIENELNQYSARLSRKHRLVVANKMDRDTARNHLRRFKRKHKVEVVGISALEKKNLEVLMSRLAQLLSV